MGKEPGLRLKIREDEEWSRPPDHPDHQADHQVDHQPGHQHDHLPDHHARLVGEVGSEAMNRRQNGRMESQHSQDTQVEEILIKADSNRECVGRRLLNCCSGDGAEDGEPAQPRRPGPVQAMPLPSLDGHLAPSHRGNL